MILLDTNVVSENFRRRPHPSVVAWIDSQSEGSLYICTPVLAEMHFGLERLPQGVHRDFLQAAINKVEDDYFKGRILILDTHAAAAYGRVVAQRQRMGRPIGSMDGLIAAIALTHRLAIATRDTDDFAGLGVEVVNPFEASVAP